MDREAAAAAPARLDDAAVERGPLAHSHEPVAATGVAELEALS